MTRPARILVLRGGALGDFLVTLPVLSALRARWPDAHIELIAYPLPGALARAAGLVDVVKPLFASGIARYFVDNATIRDDDQAYFASFDFIVQYLHDPGGVLVENLKRCGVKILLQASPLIENQHAIDHFLQPLTALALYDSDPIPRLNLPAAGSVQLDIPTAPWLAIHPGSGGRNKNWSLDAFLAVADHAEQTLGISSVFITGDAEREFIPDLDRKLGGRTWWHQPDLVELAIALGQARGYLGNDSGISHLAAAVAVPSVVMFGPTNPDLWAPRGSQVTIVTAPDGNLDNLPVQTVIEALGARLRGV
ncbi:MAG TPA: glycosyltransferase family 9 protein [Kiritimatiellia bacterium]|nr:glycosyltransferase family 9 protein [Kiritimatiellia bacterium]HMO97693.1 glycosyltransferase family 9 protein [Kiritimatiellia bacterium]